jgi:hypothetical protein
MPSKGSSETNWQTSAEDCVGVGELSGKGSMESSELKRLSSAGVIMILGTLMKR